MPIPTVESTKKTASRQLRSGDTDFLTLWFGKKLLVKVYHHYHQPVDHQSLSVLINLPLLFHSWSLCIFMWTGSYFTFLFSYSLACFLCPESPNELLRYPITTRTPTNRQRTPTDTSESTRIDKDSVTYLFIQYYAFSCYSYSTLRPSVQTYLHIYKH